MRREAIHCEKTETDIEQPIATPDWPLYEPRPLLKNRCLLRAQRENRSGFRRRRVALLRGQTHLGSAFRVQRRRATTHLAIGHRPLYTRQDSRHAMLVYIHREKNVLIEVSFHIRIPRTFKHFAGFMVCADACANACMGRYRFCICSRSEQSTGRTRCSRSSRNRVLSHSVLLCLFCSLYTFSVSLWRTRTRTRSLLSFWL